MIKSFLGKFLSSGPNVNHSNQVYVSQKILNRTIAILQVYGNKGCEGLVLWLGKISDDNTATVTEPYAPPQNSIKSEYGVGYFVTSETLFNLNKHMAETGLRLIAQVHSHPGRAYHSDADDRGCIVTKEGGYSLVVPDFGFCHANIHNWANYQLQKGSWVKLSKNSVDKYFSIVE